MCRNARCGSVGSMVVQDAPGQGPMVGYVALTGLDGIGFPDG